MVRWSSGSCIIPVPAINLPFPYPFPPPLPRLCVCVFARGRQAASPCRSLPPLYLQLLFFTRPWRDSVRARVQARASALSLLSLRVCVRVRVSSPGCSPSLVAHPPPLLCARQGCTVPCPPSLPPHAPPCVVARRSRALSPFATSPAAVAFPRLPLSQLCLSLSLLPLSIPLACAALAPSRLRGT